ncbi:GvpL/GvpF family gas vesicle protein [Streptomyces sp. 24-1644]|uniref:GvpL/GvpF family gas vesicle protein n=1 Tax=Streptomyces sp. 24-1644 TaxID=3457315 RepID=UPI003FA68BA1
MIEALAAHHRPAVPAGHCVSRRPSGAAMIQARRGAFATRLSDLAEQVEWGVKIYVVAPAAAERPEPSADPALSPGRAYLSHLRTQHHAREDTYRHAEQAARRIENAARDVAVDRVQQRAQQGELARGPGENVVNDAYLVPLAHAEQFRAVARDAEGLPGVRVEVTGPWAGWSSPRTHFAARADRLEQRTESLPVACHPAGARRP